MATEGEVFTNCPACNGTKEVLQPGWNYTEENPTRPMVTCENCNGTGVVQTGYVDDVMDKLNDIKEKVDEIKEVVDEINSKLE